MGERSEKRMVATPPRMVCQNCGLGIFNRSRLGVIYVHSVTYKAECRPGTSRRAQAKRAALSGREAT